MCFDNDCDVCSSAEVKAPLLSLQAFSRWAQISLCGLNYSTTAWHASTMVSSCNLIQHTSALPARGASSCRVAARNNLAKPALTTSFACNADLMSARKLSTKICRPVPLCAAILSCKEHTDGLSMISATRLGFALGNAWRVAGRAICSGAELGACHLGFAHEQGYLIISVKLSQSWRLTEVLMSFPISLLTTPPAVACLHPDPCFLQHGESKNFAMPWAVLGWAPGDICCT